MQGAIKESFSHYIIINDSRHFSGFPISYNMDILFHKVRVLIKHKSFFIEVFNAKK